MCPFASCHRLRNLHCTEGPFFSKAELLRTPALGSTATTPASLHQRGAAVHERPRRDNFLVALVAPLETQLAQHLLERTTPRGLDLCLLDISQPLLAAGFQNASEALRGRPGVSVWGMQANFHHLGEYPPLRRAAPQRHLYCLLGGTLGNLDHESRFFRHSLRGEPGDLLLVDLQLARSSPASPEEIKHRERSWASGVPPQIAAWLGGPIWRHCKDTNCIEFRWSSTRRARSPAAMPSTRSPRSRRPAATPESFPCTASAAMSRTG